MSHFSISHLTLRTGTSSSLWATSSGKPANVFSKSFPRIFTPWAATTSLCFSYWFWKREYTLATSPHSCYTAIQSRPELLKILPPASTEDRRTVKSSSPHSSVILCLLHIPDMHVCLYAPLPSHFGRGRAGAAAGEPSKAEIPRTFL